MFVRSLKSSLCLIMFRMYYVYVYGYTTIISECSKSAQRKYNTRHKKFKFDHRNKWYIHNPEPVRENEMQKILCDFEIQTIT